MFLKRLDTYDLLIYVYDNMFLTWLRFQNLFMQKYIVIWSAKL